MPCNTIFHHQTHRIRIQLCCRQCTTAGMLHLNILAVNPALIAGLILSYVMQQSHSVHGFLHNRYCKFHTQFCGIPTMFLYRLHFSCYLILMCLVHLQFHDFPFSSIRCNHRKFSPRLTIFSITWHIYHITLPHYSQTDFIRNSLHTHENTSP